MNQSRSDAVDVLDNRYAVEFPHSPEEVEAAMRLRYQVFCQERRIFAADGQIEIDRYDAWARHVVLRRRSDQVLVGTARLVPWSTLRPTDSMPMQQVCAPALLGGVPMELLGEISRFSLSREWRGADRGGDVLLRLGLMRGLLQLSYEIGLTHWCAAMEPSLLRLLRRVSVRFEPVGPLVEYRGLRQPAVAEIDTVLKQGRAERPALWSYVTQTGVAVAAPSELSLAA